ncbi:MAG: PHP domain-containing protein [Anaerolineae bacterium]
MINAPNCDLHTHTAYSDGRGSVEENVRAAEAAGLAAIAISDHLFGRGDEDHSVRQQLRRRAVDLQQAAAWAETRVIAAVEGTVLSPRGDVSYDQDDLAGIDLALVDTGYRTAGLAFDPPAGRTRQLGAMLGLYGRLASHPLVDVLAHPFTFGRFGLDITLADLPTGDLRDLGSALAGSGVAFELNNGVWWWWPQLQPQQTAEAYARIVAAVADGGARFTVGSDAHCNTGVGNVGWALRVAQLAGIADDRWADLDDLLRR